MLTLFTPPKFGDLQKTQQAQLLHYILLFNILIAIVSAIVFLISSKQSIQTIEQTVFLTFLGTHLAGLYAIRQGHIKVVGINVIIFIWLTLTIFAIIDAHQTPLYVLSYSMVVLCAGLLLGGQWLFAFTTLSIVSALIISRFHSQGQLLQLSTADNIGTELALQISTFLWTAISVYFVVRHLQMALHNLHQREQTLAETLSQLQISHKQLGESEARYRDLFENANDLVQGVSADGLFQYANRRWHEVMKYSPDELPSLRFTDIIRADQRPHCQTLFEQLAQGKNFNQIDIIFVTKTGKEIIVEGNLNAQFENGRFVATRGIFRNVTNRRATEKALKQRNRTTETLYYVTRSLIARQPLPTLLQAIVDTIANALHIDRVFIHLIDQEQEKLVNFVAGGPGQDNMRPLSYDMLMQSLIGWVLTQAQPATVKKGTIHDPRVKDPIINLRQEMNCDAIVVMPLTYQGLSMGTLSAINRRQDPDFTVEDIDLMVAISNQVAVAIENTRLHQSERDYAMALETQNEELNAFSHTVAHDLKNPLSGMMAQVSLIKELYKLGRYEEIDKRLNLLDRSGHLMNNIIDELLLLSQVRKTEVQVEPLDTALIIENVLHRLNFDIKAKQATIKMPEMWPTALGYGSWVEEIWINYITNAIKYGGTPPFIELGATMEKTAVKFWVRDNGSGISSEKQAHLFTPFERLEQANIKGHGLGLSIVQRIAEKLNGDVGVDSTLAKGSTFYFTLPPYLSNGDSHK